MGLSRVSCTKDLYILFALVLSSLDNTSALVFCSLGMCTISTESKFPSFLWSWLGIYVGGHPLLVHRPSHGTPPAENMSSLGLFGRLGLVPNWAILSLLHIPPGCWLPKTWTGGIVRPPILQFFRGWRPLLRPLLLQDPPMNIVHFKHGLTVGGVNSDKKSTK